MAWPPLYILRHGETEWNAENRLQGRFDSPLTARGKAQALAQRAALAGRDLTGVSATTSPQGRAFHTASLALEGLVADIQTDPRLREIGVGEWAGERRDVLMKKAPQATDTFDLYACAPGGEGFDALEERCHAFLSDLTGPAVLVTHGITSRMLRVILLGRGKQALTEIEGGQGVVFHLENGQQHVLSDRG